MVEINEKKKVRTDKEKKEGREKSRGVRRRVCEERRIMEKGIEERWKKTKQEN